IKPIDNFLTRWEQIRRDAVSALEQESDFCLAIVGGGPASIEFALAARQRIIADADCSTSSNNLCMELITADDELLKAHNQKVRDHVSSTLEKAGIRCHTGHEVVEFRPGEIVCASDRRFQADAIVYATGASVPHWPARIGLATTDAGFIEVNSSLQSTSHEFVFAAGDAATIIGWDRPKSGVYAVRHGKPLARNLRRYATGRSLVKYRPQKHALALLNLSDGTAAASRNNFFAANTLVWKLKHRIDLAFRNKYTELPEMTPQWDLATGLLDRKTEQQLRDHALRCGGCGAKVSASVLEEVLQSLQQLPQQAVQQVEDAAIIDLGDDRVLLQSVDQLREFLNDPWLFARIVSNHCLSDIHAMGVMPTEALALVNLPFASKAIHRSLLHELMSGCLEVLAENNCKLLGGHSSESAELAFGLCVNGVGHKESLLRKRGMQSGEVLILTKPLGTGTILAADMRARARHGWVQQAIEQMLVSNAAAARIFLAHAASSCTDITGFGLAGHLSEMLGESAQVELELAAVPALAGALQCLELGITSSLHADNSAVSRLISNTEQFFDHNYQLELLFDPQTAGGLLASVPEAKADACIAALHQAGYAAAGVIGRVISASAATAAMVLK
ncbi:MAG: selenide, water dikinase SelD, partial [Gammaproteobacteria bacterium]